MQSLQEILLYGLKGMAAYANHARRLGKTYDNVNAFIGGALLATVTNVNFDMDSLFEMVIECGRHTDKFGTPEPTTIWIQNDFITRHFC